jgi:citrate synthase
MSTAPIDVSRSAAAPPVPSVAPPAAPVAAAAGAPAAPAVPEGLAGVVVTDTRISDVDGAHGRLVLAGYDVEALAGRQSFEGVLGLLLRAAGIDPPTDLAARLGAARVAAFDDTEGLRAALRLDDPAEAVRAFVGLRAASPGGHEAVVIDDVLGVVAATGVVAASWPQRRATLIAPRADLGHAADLLRLMRGGDAPAASAAEARALDGYLVTIADHGLNASTFAARVVASTGSDLVSAVTAGIAALKGPLHGGAPGPVLDMFDAVGDPGRARAWLEAELAAGRRIMGMGHRVYRVRDPRALVLERLARELEASSPAIADRIALARAIERDAEALLAARHPDRPLKANVEFYTAVLLEALALDRRLFTATFAAGRVAGWCAHVLEQRARGRLIRPDARYVGARHESDTSVARAPMPIS